MLSGIHTPRSRTSRGTGLLVLQICGFSLEGTEVLGCGHLLLVEKANRLRKRIRIIVKTTKEESGYGFNAAKIGTLWQKAQGKFTPCSDLRPFPVRRFGDGRLCGASGKGTAGEARAAAGGSGAVALPGVSLCAGDGAGRCT